MPGIHINRGEIKEWRIENWVKAFSQLYEVPDRDKKLSNIWMNVMDDASDLAEAIRRGLFDNAARTVPHIFCWYCCFVAKLREYTPNIENNPGLKALKDGTNEELNVTAWVLEKYPELCPACGDNPCRCPSFRDEVESRHENGKDLKSGNLLYFSGWSITGMVYRTDRSKRLKSEKAAKSVEDLSLMFQKIYSGVHYDLPIEAICFHLLEEIGEVMEVLVNMESLQNIRAESGEEDLYCEVFRNLQETLRSELGDVFSWITAIIDKINAITKATSSCQKLENTDSSIRTLTQLILKEYVTKTGEFMCPHCKNKYSDGKDKCSPKCITQKLFRDYKDEKEEKDALEIINEKAGPDLLHTRVYPRHGVYVFDKKRKKFRIDF